MHIPSPAVLHANPVVVVMGVSGTGKSTVSQALADRYGFTFLDADDFHPPENVAKMRAGIPLSDADRSPWLDSLAARLAVSCQGGERTALACSALKASYRARLDAGCPGLLFAFLEGSRAVIAERLAARQNHYMPPTLLDSQLATLEVPDPASENVLPIDCQLPPATIAASIGTRLGLDA